MLLRGDWWRRDAGPLLAWWQKDDEANAAVAVALLPVPGGYEVHDPVTGTVRRVDEAVADALKGQARMLYRRLPDTPLALADLLRFGLRDAGSPLRRLSLVGLLSALLALSVPFGTNMLVEEIIPRGMIDQHWILVCGLLAAALGVGSFQLVRALLTVAIEGRLDWSLQAGLFDRLLRMAPGFFSSYSAGDLAERVLGIQAMREKLSGAALTAMQSLAFSLLSLGARFFFDAKLAVVGVLLAIDRLRQTVRHLGYGDGAVLDTEEVLEDEVDDAILDSVSQAGADAAGPPGPASVSSSVTVITPPRHPQRSKYAVLRKHSRPPARYG